MLTHFSLFSGIGGIDLAAEWAGFETVGQCEFADYPTKVLEKHWPNVPRWRDIRDVNLESIRSKGIGAVTLVSGGFPCQPFSVAGNQKGKEDERYLWPEMLRVIREIKPRWVLGENVPGILSIAADEICKNLEQEGYEVGIFNYEAAAVGARHRRERIFFVGYSKHNGLSTIEKLRSNEKASNQWRAEEQEKTREFEGTNRPTDVSSLHRCENGSKQNVGNTISSRCNREPWGRSGQEFEDGYSRLEEKPEVISNSSSFRLSGQREFIKPINSKENRNRQASQSLNVCIRNQWSVEPNVGRVANGVSNRVDRLKCLGNAVVPQQIYPILQAIADIENVGSL